MSFAGVSVITNGDLLGDGADTNWTTSSASRYHLLVVQGDMRTNTGPIWSHDFTVGGYGWNILYNRMSDSDEESDSESYHDSNSDTIKLGLSLDVNITDPVKAQANFTFVGSQNQEQLYTHGGKIINFRSESCVEYITGEALKKHLIGDCFTVRCDIVIVNNGTTSSPVITLQPSDSDMQQNFTNLLLAGEGTDVVFQLGSETIAAHRCILAARSTVFRAALFGPMKEGTPSTTPSVVQIDDMDAAVFKAMLGFIYGDMLPALNDESEEDALKDESAEDESEEDESEKDALKDESAEDQSEEDEGEEDALKDESEEDVALMQHLLVAADRYDLRKLILMCEKQLCKHIGVGTVTSNLALAEQHGCARLKKACCEFLRCPDNLRAVVATDGFDHQSCPPVMKDMILGMLPPK